MEVDNPLFVEENCRSSGHRPLPCLLQGGQLNSTWLGWGLYIDLLLLVFAVSQETPSFLPVPLPLNPIMKSRSSIHFLSGPARSTTWLYLESQSTSKNHGSRVFWRIQYIYLLSALRLPHTTRGRYTRDPAVLRSPPRR